MTATTAADQYRHLRPIENVGLGSWVMGFDLDGNEEGWVEIVMVLSGKNLATGRKVTTLRGVDERGEGVEFRGFNNETVTAIRKADAKRAGLVSAR